MLEGVDDLTEGAKIEVIPEGGVAPRRDAGGAGPGGARGRRGAARRGGPRRRGAARGRRAHEHLAPVHHAPGGDRPADGRVDAVGPARLSPAAGVGAAAGGLPDHPDPHVLPGRQPRGHDQRGHGAAGAPVRADAGARPDVVHQLGWRVGDHAAVQPRQAHRGGRAGSAGRHQRGQQPAAQRPAAAAGLQQGQPGRHARADAGGDVQDRAAAPGARPGGHARGAEAVAASRRRAWSASPAVSARPCGFRPTRRRWPRTA